MLQKIIYPIFFKYLNNNHIMILNLFFIHLNINSLFISIISYVLSQIINYNLDLLILTNFHLIHILILRNII